MAHIEEAMEYHRRLSLRHHGRIFDLAILKHLPTAGTVPGVRKKAGGRRKKVVGEEAGAVGAVSAAVQALP
jgi:hypothetical protein